MAVQGFQRRHLAELGFAGGRGSIPNRPSSDASRPLEAAAEFGILVEMGVLDHLQQHAVRGDQARLAFDHHGEAGNILGARRQFAVDQLQFAGIDIKLGGRRDISASGFCRSRRRAQAQISAGRRDRDLSPPQQAAELQHAEARRTSRARAGAASGLA